MLRKLLKHELRATSRWMLPMFLLVLLASALARFAGSALIDADNNVLNTIGVILLMIFVFSVMGVCVLAFVLMLYRFWKNLLSDEGYLMMTLPVSVHQHILSKLLLVVFWYVCTVLVLLGAVFILTYEIGFFADVFRAVQLFFRELQLDWKAWQSLLTLAEGLLILLFGALLTSLWVCAAMAVGHSFANHKTLLSVVAFFLMEMAMQMIGSIAAGLIPENVFYHMEHTAVLGCVLALELLTATAFYFITAYFLEKRLTLE